MERRPSAIIFSNAGSEKEAHRIARSLVEERLAACVNIIPLVQSYYRWQGQVESAQEWTLLIKTREDLAERAVQRLAALHSYELPAAVIVPIAGGHEPYLKWIGESVQPQETLSSASEAARQRKGVSGRGDDPA